jgi:hypothetical protein
MTTYLGKPRRIILTINLSRFVGKCSVCLSLLDDVKTSAVATAAEAAVSAMAATMPAPAWLLEYEQYVHACRKRFGHDALPVCVQCWRTRCEVCEKCGFPMMTTVCSELGYLVLRRVAFTTTSSPCTDVHICTQCNKHRPKNSVVCHVCFSWMPEFGECANLNHDIPREARRR